MKKILLFVVIAFVLAAAVGVAAVVVNNNLKNTVNINGKTLTLKYSTCGLGAEVCLNEYYLKDEYDTKWTELFTVVYSPTANDPQTIAQNLEYAAMMGYMVGSNNFRNDEENSNLVEYGIMFNTDNGEPAIEQNTAKVMLYPYGDGVIVQQYARRYIFDKNKSAEETKKDLREHNDTYLKVMSKLEARKVYMKPLQKW